MVKGCSRQVIVVHNPQQKLFEQAIFILSDSAVAQGVTDETLMKEANRLIRNGGRDRKPPLYVYGPVWAVGGALVMGAIWAISHFF